MRTPFQQEYFESHPDCEIFHLLKKNRQFVPYCSFRFQAALNENEYYVARCPRSVHHIFRGQGRRVDNGSNLITLLDPVHEEYCHRAGMQNQARIVCLSAKLRAKELDIRELDDACGFSFHGWICDPDHIPMMESWLKPLWAELCGWADWEMRWEANHD